METIKIQYLNDEIERLRYIDGKSDWIDLRAAEEVELKAGEFKLIHLGVAMQLPEGYEAHIVPRSSTFKEFRYYPDEPLRYHRRELLRTERLVLHAGVCPARHRDSCE